MKLLKRRLDLKRVASATLWVVLFAGIVADSNDKLQSAFRLIPARFSPYLPILYGLFALAALTLLHFAHLDDLESAKSSRDERLSRAQRSTIARILRQYARPASLDPDAQYRYFIIYPVPGVAAAEAIAAQLRKVFGEFGFDAQLVTDELPGLRDISRFEHGFWLRGSKGFYAAAEDPPRTHEIILEALSSAAIDCKTTDDDVGDVELIVGAISDTASDAEVLAVATAKYERLVATQQEEISLAKAKLTQLERDQPRHLSDDAREIIKRRLLPTLQPWIDAGRVAQIGVHNIPGNDSASYAREFEDLFRAMGFSLMRAGMKQYVSDDGVYDDYSRGLFIRQDSEYRRVHKLPPLGDLLFEALGECGIPVTKLERVGCFLELIVGDRSV